MFAHATSLVHDRPLPLLANGAKVKKNFKGTEITDLSIKGGKPTMTAVKKKIGMDRGRLGKLATHGMLILFSSSYLGGCDFNRSADYYRSIYERCSSAAPGVTAPSSDTICIKGKIEKETAVIFVEVAKNIQPTYIVLESEGGFLTPAIDIGDIIADKGTTAIVNGICASSCSQFIFIAAKNKIILPDGGVFFHGGPISEKSISEMKLDDNQKENLLQEQVRFREFYSDRGVSLDMVTKPPQSVQTRLDNGEIVFWSWNEKELENFGVTNVTQYSK